MRTRLRARSRVGGVREPNRIDLIQVVFKYTGETEKNSRRVFDTADTGGRPGR